MMRAIAFSIAIACALASTVFWICYPNLWQKLPGDVIAAILLATIAESIFCYLALNPEKPVRK